MPPRESTSSVHPTLTVIRDALGCLLRLFRPIRQSVTPDRATEVDCSHFEAAIAKIAAGGESWFITGAAGTGKSTLLRCLMRRLKHRAVVLAPTGLAALNVGGQTIHSFFRLPPEVLDNSNISFDPLRAHLYRALDTVIVDEVSMVRADLMNAIDVSLRRHRESPAPFGGCQLVLIGDLFQLPPVVPSSLAGYFKDAYGGPYFFNAPGVPRLQLRYHRLDRVFRQNDPTFVELLGRVRHGRPTDSDLIRLNSRHISVAGVAPEAATVLTTTNAVASRINRDALASLPGHPLSNEAIMSGSVRKQYDALLLKHGGNPDQLDQALESAFPAPLRVVVKPGARVIMVKNDGRKRWVNGTIATVVQVDATGLRIRIGEAICEVERETWERIEYQYDGDRLSRKVLGAFAQYPVRLAWALTIHKAQGQSLDAVCVDLTSSAFAPGQTYVELAPI